jgi:ABC-type sugar transport system ATPase subunit
VTLGIRPEQLTVRPATADDGAGSTAIIGRLEGAELLGYESVLHVRVGTNSLSARADPAVVPPVGSMLALGVDAAHVHLFDQVTGVALDGGR